MTPARRRRAIAFACAAAICAAIAASVAGNPGGASAPGLDQLRQVVVTSQPLPAGQRLDRRQAAGSLSIRRLPSGFVSAGALSEPAQAVGRRLAAAIPAGTYLLVSHFESERAPPPSARPRLRAGRRPVEIAVQATGATATRAFGPRGTVDVIVTTEASPGGGAGRTYVAARRVRLLDLRAAGISGAPGSPAAPAPADGSIATLALRRSEALELIHAQSFAREIRLIGSR